MSKKIKALNPVGGGSPTQREMIILQKLEQMQARMNEMAAAQPSPRNMLQLDPFSPNVKVNSPSPTKQFGQDYPSGDQQHIIAFRQKVVVYMSGCVPL